MGELTIPLTDPHTVPLACGAASPAGRPVSLGPILPGIRGVRTPIPGADVQDLSERPEEWGRALRLGVDGLQTDQPTRLVRFLRDRLPR